MKKILLVDDHRDNLDVLSFLFKDEGFEVMELQTAKNIVEDIAIFKPDLILMDVMLGSENGMEVCSRLKANPETARIKIVLMTASNTFQKLHQIFARADHYLLKPFDIHEVVKMTNELLATDGER